MHQTKRALREKDDSLSSLEGRVALNKASQDISNIDSSKLEEIRNIYSKLGMSYDLATKFSTLISDTLQRELRTAKHAQDELSQQLLSIASDIRLKCEKLDILLPKSITNMDEDLMLAEKLDLMMSDQKIINEKYDQAITKRIKIIDGTKSVLKSLGWSIDEPKVAPCLQHLLSISDDAPLGSDTVPTNVGKAKRQALLQHVEHMVHSAMHEIHNNDDLNDTTEKQIVLSSSFLNECDEALRELKRKKSNQFLQNIHLLSECSTFATDMNLTKTEVKDLSSLYISRYHHEKAKLLLSSQSNLQAISHSIAAATQSPSPTAAAKSDEMYSDLLCLVHKALTSVATIRSKFSEALRRAVDHAQAELLTSVSLSEVDKPDEHMDNNTINEALQGFNDALHRLPRLSKELILTCIEELRALTSAAESMTTSEIEALTVVWEALDQDISPHQRQGFWVNLEDGMKSLEVEVNSPFDLVMTGLNTSGDNDKSIVSSMVEEWIYGAIRDATKSYRLLSLRLFKLSKVHNDVECNRSLQDTKSQILSLDSEICITSVQLNEFEDKAGSKQRLLSKKKTSINLLREEKFRKQMQTKVAAQLANLLELLQKWEDLAKRKFDINRLSTEVKALLVDEKAHQHQTRVTDSRSSWAQETTAFMHLRTTTAIKGNRQDQRLSSNIKRVSSPLDISSSEAVPENESLSESDSSSRSTHKLLGKKDSSHYNYQITPPISKLKTGIKSPGRAARGNASTVSIKSRKLDRIEARTRSAQSSRSSTPHTARSISPAPASLLSQMNIRGSKKEVMPRSLSKPKHGSPPSSSKLSKAPLRTKYLRSNGAKPAAHEPKPRPSTNKPANASNDREIQTNHQDTLTTDNVPTKLSSKRNTLMPFESILNDTPIKGVNKENNSN